jgi:hypothetical protein
MFLNRDGQAPISTHPARAHKHAAPQTVPKKHQAAIEKMPYKESILKFCPSYEYNNPVWNYDPTQMWHNRFRQSPLLTYKDYMHIEVLMEPRRGSFE